MVKKLKKEQKGTVTKKIIINKVSQKIGVHPVDTKQIIQSFLDTMIDYLEEGYRLEFRNFGILEVVIRKQKIGRNPKKADQPIIIPAGPTVRFKPGKQIIKRVNKKC